MQKSLKSSTASAEAKKDFYSDDNVVRFISGELSSSETSSSWAINSRAASHMNHDKSLFVKLGETAYLSMKVGDVSDVHAKGKGVSFCKVNLSTSVQC